MKQQQGKESCSFLLSVGGRDAEGSREQLYLAGFTHASLMVECLAKNLYAWDLKQLLRENLVKGKNCLVMN